MCEVNGYLTGRVTNFDNSGLPPFLNLLTVDGISAASLDSTEFQRCPNTPI